MSPASEHTFMKLVVQNGLLFPATSVRPMRADKAALRRLRRQAERRHHGAKQMGSEGQEA